MVHATHVTDTAGTGVVHMAPAHGQEDHAACAAAGIVLAHEYDLLDDSGCFRPAAGERLAGALYRPAGVFILSLSAALQLLSLIATRIS